MDLASTRFWIGFKITWSQRFLAFFLEQRGFLEIHTLEELPVLFLGMSIVPRDMTLGFDRVIRAPLIGLVITWDPSSTTIKTKYAIVKKARVYLVQDETINTRSGYFQIIISKIVN